MILLQHATGRVKELLDIARPHHERICKKWGWTYRVDTKAMLKPEDVGVKNINHPYDDQPRMGCWEKWRAIRDLMHDAVEGELVAFVDADAIVAGRLDDALPSGDMGLVEYAYGLNSGVIVFRSNQTTKKFTSDILKVGQVPKASDKRGADCLSEERTMNVMCDRYPYRGPCMKLLPYDALDLKILPEKYNTRSKKTPDTRVRAWHQAPHGIKVLEMKKYVRRLEQS
jgi:hypothetical protein